jgi:uncharacterized protein
MRILADTGLFIALLDRRDQYHSWATRVVQRYQPPFYTCEAVIAEAAYMLARTTRIEGVVALMGLVADGLIAIDFNVADHASRIATLVKRYADIPMDYADACLVVMTEQEQYRKCLILTVDAADFLIYRRNGRSSIPIETPNG